jgi:hypothetical protein
VELLAFRILAPFQQSHYNAVWVNESRPTMSVRIWTEVLSMVNFLSLLFIRINLGSSIEESRRLRGENGKFEQES